MGGSGLSKIFEAEDTKSYFVNFLLYCTPSTKNTFTELIHNDNKSIDLSNFDANKKTKVLIHGFDSHVFSQFPRNVKDAYLEKHGNDYNVICVNWGKRSSGPLDLKIYPANLEAAARSVTGLLIWLVEKHKLNPTDVHLVGHCLGAHVCGMVGHSMHANRKTIGRISALDLAGCGFDRKHTAEIRMLAKTDADFVDVYRTDQFIHLLEELPRDLHCKLNLRMPDPPAAELAATSSKFNNLKVNNDVNFLLYCNPKNKYEGTELILNDIESIQRSNFDARKETKVLIHGLNSHAFVEFPRNVKDAYLENQYRNDYNVICVNWSKWSGETPAAYLYVVDLLEAVAEHVRDFLIWLAEATELELEAVHLVGHSLGADICGRVGRSVQVKTKGTKLGRISALDQPSTIPGIDDARRMLEETDADFVDAYLTSSLSRTYGYHGGQVNFIINGGLQQPICSGRAVFNQETWNHAEAHRFFAKTILDGPNKKNWTRAKRAFSMGEDGPRSNRILLGEHCVPGTVGKYTHCTDEGYHSQVQ